MNQKKPVILDCDNTFGIPGCDVDDGLALLYLLGRRDVALLGITCTYGNSDIDTVFENTRRMLHELGREDIPVFRGAGAPIAAGDSKTPAEDFLVAMADQHDGMLSILATGSLTNLYGAYLWDRNFFGRISEISLMGGLTAPLLINGRNLNELNFSCDPQAAYTVLTKGKKVAVATGNNCLQAFFTRDGYEERFGAKSTPIQKYLYEKTAYWFDDQQKAFGINGFYNWDVTAAAILTEPGLFREAQQEISPTIESLKNGYLNGGGKKVLVSLPEIKDFALLEQTIYQSYWDADVFPTRKEEYHHGN